MPNPDQRPARQITGKDSSALSGEGIKQAELRAVEEQFGIRIAYSRPEASHGETLLDSG